MRVISFGEPVFKERAKEIVRIIKNDKWGQLKEGGSRNSPAIGYNPAIVIVDLPVGKQSGKPASEITVDHVLLLTSVNGRNRMFITKAGLDVTSSVKP